MNDELNWSANLNGNFGEVAGFNAAQAVSFSTAADTLDASLTRLNSNPALTRGPREAASSFSQASQAVLGMAESVSTATRPVEKMGAELRATTQAAVALGAQSEAFDRIGASADRAAAQIAAMNAQIRSRDPFVGASDTAWTRGDFGALTQTPAERKAWLAEGRGPSGIGAGYNSRFSSLDPFQRSENVGTWTPTPEEFWTQGRSRSWGAGYNSRFSSLDPFQRSENVGTWTPTPEEFWTQGRSRSWGAAGYNSRFSSLDPFQRSENVGRTGDPYQRSDDPGRHGGVPFTPTGSGPRGGGGGGGSSLSMGDLWMGYFMAHMALSGVERVGRGAVEFVQEGLEQSSLKSGFLTNAAAYLPGKMPEARQFYGELQGIADRSPLQKQDVASSAQTFLAAGMNRGTSTTLVQAMSDLIANPNMKEGSYRELSKIALAGVTSGNISTKTYRELGELSGGVITQKSLTQAVADRNQISFAKATAELSNAATKQQKFAEGLVELSQKRDFDLTGSRTPGGASALFGLDAEGAIATTADRVHEMFRDIDRGTVAQGLSGINEQLRLGGPLMDSFKHGMQQMFTGIVEPWVGQYRDPAIASRDLAKAAELFNQIGVAASGASAGLKGLLDVITTIGGILPAGTLLPKPASGPDEQAHNFTDWVTGSVFSPLGPLSPLAPIGRVSRFSVKGLYDQNQRHANAAEGYNQPGAIHGLPGSGTRGFAGSGTRGFDPSSAVNRVPASFHSFDDGGINLIDRLALVHKDEAVIPLNRAQQVLGDAMGGGGRQIIVHVHSGAFQAEIHGGEGEDVKVTLEERLPSNMQAFAETLAAQIGVRE